VGGDVAQRGIAVLFLHKPDIFRQPKTQDALDDKSAVLFRIKGQWIDIPEEVP
jgi:hypothetical protein